MSKLAFDASLVSVQRMDGLNRYSLAVLKRFPREGVVFIANRQVIRHFKLKDFIQVPVGFSQPGFIGNLYRMLWRTVVFPFQALAKGVGGFYSPVHEGQTLRFFRQVITIHDFLPFIFPASYPRLRFLLKAFMPRWIRQSARIICVSRSTFHDLLELYPLAPPVQIIYEGNDVDPSQDSEPGLDEERETFASRVQGEPFILMVAEHRPYKNTANGIRGFARSGVVDRAKLVLVGKVNRLTQEILDLPRQLGIEDRVVFTGFVSDSFLHELYHRARMFMLPSLYEGFGLPLLEALEAGCPSLASRSSSLPEVGGAAVEYFDPLHPADIARALESRFQDLEDGHGEEIRKKSLIQAGNFSFDKAVREIWGVVHA